jgi:hypothetical protein
MGYVHDEAFSSAASGRFGSSYFEVKGNSWEFPILMKYRLGRWHAPSVSGGYVLRRLGPVRARGVNFESDPFPVRHTVTTQVDTAQPTDLYKRDFWGIAVGSGMEFGFGWLCLLPEVRYTHWLDNIGGTAGALRLVPDQVEFLLGFTVALK